ncbi:MAG: acyltransferase domain-containing protein, partial [Bacteriovoracaceae bacterium]
MTKVSLIFPGQGSQYVGMGKNLQNLSESKRIFEEADDALDFSLTQIMFEGPEEKLKLTEYTQPAIVAHSIALFERLKNILQEKNVQIERVLGHSVGVYSALCAAGA